MTRDEYLKQVAAGQMAPAYLFLGEEDLFHEELLTATLKKLLPGQAADFNLCRMDGANVEPSQLQEQLETSPFFGGVRVVYISRLENSKNGLDETVLQELSRMAPGVYLLVSVFKLDGRKKVHKELSKQLLTVNCDKLRAQELPVWINKRAKELGLKLTPVQAIAIGRRLGPDLMRIQTELEKLVTFTGTGGQLSDASLDDLIPEEGEFNIFALTDGMIGGNPQQSIPRLQELLDAGENELRILATISRQFRNIAAAIDARSQGMNVNAFAASLGIKSFAAQKSWSQSSRFKLADLQKVINRLLWADYRIKTGQRLPRLELELAVVEISLGCK